MSFENGGLTPDGRIKLVWVDDPPEEPDPRWQDRPCFICGSTESWFSVTMSSDQRLAFCKKCVPTGRMARTGIAYMRSGEDVICLEELTRALWNQSHAARIR